MCNVIGYIYESIQFLYLFQLPNDMENYIRYHVLGFVGKVMLKPGCLPTKFQCQSDRKRSLPSTITSCPDAIKRQRLAIIQEALEYSTLKSDTEEVNTTLSPSKYLPEHINLGVCYLLAPEMLTD